ncbi:MAG: hypothetical protein AB7G15_03030 [Alphaproteobacteria bacterium]
MRLRAVWFVAFAVASCCGGAQAMDTRTAVLAAMTEQYGRYDAEARAWKHRIAGEPYVYMMRVREARKLAVPGAERLYIVASGDMEKPDEVPRAASGLAGLFVYEQHAGKVRFVAGIKDLRVGDGGRAAFDARLTQFGPDHYYGWIVGLGSIGQGWSIERQLVLAPHGRAVDTLAALRKSIDSEGVFPCHDPGLKEKCMSLKYALTVDTSKAAEHVFPLILEKSGVQDGRTIVPETFHIPFDEKTWRYLTPRAVQPE